MINLIKPAYAAERLGDNYAFGGIASLGEGLGYLVAPGFQIAAVAVILYFIVGAYKLITSSGDKEALASSRAMITHAIIGFVLLMLMFAVLQFVPKFFSINIGFIQ